MNVILIVFALMILSSAALMAMVLRAKANDEICTDENENKEQELAGRNISIALSEREYMDLLNALTDAQSFYDSLLAIDMASNKVSAHHSYGYEEMKAYQRLRQHIVNSYCNENE